MAINQFMRLALKALSYPDIDIRKTYQIQRSLQTLKGPKLPKQKQYCQDCTLYVDNRSILTRIYLPANVPHANTLLFFHGGGWVTESIDTYHKVCTALANATKHRVVSVEYRLAPEHPFPQGLEDCYAVAKQLFLFPQRFGFSPGKITLIGDSAGGNLAAAVSLKARDEGDFEVPRQILIYPATYYDHSPASPYRSVVDNGSDYLLTSKRICEYIDLYKRSDDDLTNPYFAPLTASHFSHQPDTLMITAEFDPLRDEGEAYAQRLKEAGNRAAVYRMKDALHGFLGLGTRYVHVRKAHELIVLFLTRSEQNESEKPLA